VPPNRQNLTIIRKWHTWLSYTKIINYSWFKASLLALVCYHFEVMYSSCYTVSTYTFTSGTLKTKGMKIKKNSPFLSYYSNKFQHNKETYPSLIFCLRWIPSFVISTCNKIKIAGLKLEAWNKPAFPSKFFTMEKMLQQPLGKKEKAAHVEKAMESYWRCRELHWDNRHRWTN